MLDKTSIIVVACDFNTTLRRISKACLGAIAKFTDRDSYELIFVDQNPCTEIASRYHKIDIDKQIWEGDIGGSQAFNRGAKESNPDYKYICFMHNDFIVNDGWLPAMLKPLNEGFKYTMPHQGITTREDLENFRRDPTIRGNDDAGMVCMTKESFKETGGWDERFPNILQDLYFRKRFSGPMKVVTWPIMTHISGITALADQKRREEWGTKEGEQENAIRQNQI